MPGQKCTWVRVSTGADPATQLGQVGCVANGTVALDAPCMYGASGATTGFDNCMSTTTAPLICLASPDTEMATGACRSMCSLMDATLPCAAGFSCGAYSKFFSNDSADPPVAGVCDATCNILTRVRNSDGALECNSAMPAMPNRGCYGFPSDTASPTDFSCTGMSAAAALRGHRVVVAAPIYTNSCVSSAIPMLRESSGSMQVVCIAFCDSLIINIGTPAGNRAGASPYSCPQVPILTPANRATGAGERCQKMWFWEGATTPITTQGNDLGVCVDFTKYTWDADNMPATPAVPWTLPETTTACANPADSMTWTPTEDCFWGTTDLPLTLTGSHTPARRAADLGFTNVLPTSQMRRDVVQD